MVTLEQLISYKKDEHDMFGDSYRYVIGKAYNDFISKLNGNHRVAQELTKYDNEAKALFYYQFKVLSPNEEMEKEVDECFQNIDDFDLSSIDDERLYFIQKNIEQPNTF